MAVKLTAGKLNFSSYQGYFGLFVLLLGCYLMWETSPAGQRSKAKAKEAAKAFEASVKNRKPGEAVETGVRLRSFSLGRCVFTFCGVEFAFNPVLPFVGGIVISSIAAFLGVGGGFLLVPFLTSITQLLMYLAAGTSALAVLVSMITGITTLLLHGVTVDWSLVGGLSWWASRWARSSAPIPPAFLRHLAEAPLHRPCLVCGHGLRLARLFQLPYFRLAAEGQGFSLPCFVMGMEVFLLWIDSWCIAPYRWFPGCRHGATWWGHACWQPRPWCWAC